MTKRHRDDVEPLYLVVRVDLPVPIEAESVAQAIQVVEALPTAEEAEAEAIRLNSVNAGKPCIYFAQYVRNYPGGRRLGSKAP